MRNINPDTIQDINEVYQYIDELFDNTEKFNHDSIKVEVIELIKKLIRHKDFDINYKYKNPEEPTLLFKAISKSLPDLVTYILSVKNLNLSIVNNKKDTILHLAMKMENTQILKILLEDLRAPLDTKDSDGFTVYDNWSFLTQAILDPEIVNPVQNKWFYTEAGSLLKDAFYNKEKIAENNLRIRTFLGKNTPIEDMNVAAHILEYASCYKLNQEKDKNLNSILLNKGNKYISLEESQEYSLYSERLKAPEDYKLNSEKTKNSFEKQNNYTSKIMEEKENNTFCSIL